MEKIFKEQDGFQFYSILFNELNSVKNTQQNAIDLLNLLEYSGDDEDGNIISSAIQLLEILKRMAFSNSVDVKDKDAVNNCIKVVFNSDCKKIYDGLENFNADYLTESIVIFIKSDVFSQRNPMNNVSLACVNFLNDALPILVEKFTFTIKNETGNPPIEVTVEPPTDDDDGYEDGTELAINIVNQDIAGYTIDFAAIYDGEDDDASLLKYLTDSYDESTGKLFTGYEIHQDSVLKVKFKTV
jgi:hypothetical protein